MRIAVVGAGVSGLVAAHLLNAEHEVTLFEAAGYLGGHANTVRVDTPNETHAVDTGFIVFNDRNYPNFERLLARQTDLQAVGLQDITDSYVETLRRWRANFAAHSEELAEMGYEEAFQRLWALYLAYCEGGFAERRICDVQLLLTKPQWAVKARWRHSAAVAATG
jgi:cyclopropane fatty-acyl-phospholipid synthase-like methyltransferase